MPAHSAALKKDMHYFAAHRYNPLIVDGNVDAERYLTFVTEYNALISNRPKPLRRIIDKIMKL